MPESSAPPEKQPMPTPTRVAVILLALLGVLLLATAALIWLQQEPYVDDLVRRGATRESAGRTALLLLIAYAVMGLTAIVSALFLPRRRPWARQTGVLVASLLAAISAVLMVLNGVATPQVLLILVSALAATTSLLARQTKDWVHGVVRLD